MTSMSPLRPVVRRLVNTPVEDLPRFAHFLGTSLANCASIFQQTESVSPENAALVHKLKTRISSLLQDKTVEGRFTATVLIKSIIEAAGNQILSTSESWPRILVTCLNKPDPPDVKELYLVTLLRVFVLCKGSSTLEREISIPLIPSLLTASLALVKPTIVTKRGIQRSVPSVLLTSVLRCWAELLKLYPQTLRPFLTRIKPIALSIIGDDASPISATQQASRVLTSLHLCAPKNGSATEFGQLISEVIDSGHSCADQVLHGVKPKPGTERPGLGKPRAFAQAAGINEADLFVPVPWEGIAQGVGRLVALVGLLEGLCLSPTPQTVSMPLTRILGLISRLLVVPYSTGSFVKYANKEEGEELCMWHPKLRVACLRFLHTLVKTYGKALLPLSETVCEQALGVLGARSSASEGQSDVYRLCATMLENLGHSGLVKDPEHLPLLVKQCCEDIRSVLKPTAISTVDQPQLNGQASGATNLKSVTSVSQIQGSSNTISDLELVRSAMNLLTSILQYVPSSYIPTAARSTLDSTAILSGNIDAMLASVLNPSSTEENQTPRPSILPFLVRKAANDLAVEALLRPRMPVIVSAAADGVGYVNGTESVLQNLTQDNEVTEDERLRSSSAKSVEDGPEGTQTERKRDFTDMNQQSSAGLEQSSMEEDPQGNKKLKPAESNFTNSFETVQAPQDSETMQHPASVGVTDLSAVATVNGHSQENVASPTFEGANGADNEDEDADEIPTVDPGTDTDEEIGE